MSFYKWGQQNQPYSPGSNESSGLGLGDIFDSIMSIFGGDGHRPGSGMLTDLGTEPMTLPESTAPDWPFGGPLVVTPKGMPSQGSLTPGQALSPPDINALQYNFLLKKKQEGTLSSLGAALVNYYKAYVEKGRTTFSPTSSSNNPLTNILKQPSSYLPPGMISNAQPTVQNKPAADNSMLILGLGGLAAVVLAGGKGKGRKRRKR